MMALSACMMALSACMMALSACMMALSACMMALSACMMALSACMMALSACIVDLTPRYHGPNHTYHGYKLTLIYHGSRSNLPCICLTHITAPTIYVLSGMYLDSNCTYPGSNCSIFHHYIYLVSKQCMFPPN